MSAWAHPIAIAGTAIGPGKPVYIVAELSANHCQRFEAAAELVRAAKAAGADAIKLQTYTPDTLTLRSDRPEFRLDSGTLWDGRTLYELYQEAHTPWEWQPQLKQIAEETGITLFSTPFDPTAVEFLEAMRVPAYKIASFEIVDLPLIRRIASTGKPVILSTGMSTLAEIDEALSAARGAGASQVALLYCNSAYPTPPEEMNLRTIPHLAQAFGVPVGLSDHSLGIAAATAAVALGACILEKHLTLDRKQGGPDAAFSLEPHEFREMVDAVRFAERALGEVRYGPTPRQRPSLRFRRSLYVVADVAEGEPFTSANVRSIRPSDGLHPRYLPQILGRSATRKISAGTPLDWDLVG